MKGLILNLVLLTVSCSNALRLFVFGNQLHFEYVYLIGHFCCCTGVTDA